MLRGLVVPVPTLFGEEGELDAGRNGSFVRGISAAGVDHVFVLSAVGELASVEEAERPLFLESTIESLTGKSDAWVGVGAPSTRLAVRYAQSAEERGAGALVAVPPYFLHPTPEAVAHYYRALRDGSRIPLLAANLPALAGYPSPRSSCTGSARERILDGVVDAAGFLTSVEGFLGGAPDGFAVFSGVDGLAADAIGKGGSGAVLESGNVVPKLAVALVRAALAHETARASELQGLVDRVAGAVRAGPFPSATKFLISQNPRRVVGIPSPVRSPHPRGRARRDGRVRPASGTPPPLPVTSTAGVRHGSVAEAAKRQIPNPARCALDEEPWGSGKVAHGASGREVGSGPSARSAGLRSAASSSRRPSDRARSSRTAPAGAPERIRILTVETANVYDPATKTSKVTKIVTVRENPANPNFVQRNIITKGAILETELGLVRVRSRPGQDGVVNAVRIGERTASK